MLIDFEKQTDFQFWKKHRPHRIQMINCLTNTIHVSWNFVEVHNFRNNFAIQKKLV